MVGLIAVLSACMTSGLAGVYLEKILKQSSTSIWLRNMQLALFGVVISLGGCLLQDGSKISDAGFMQGFIGCIITLPAPLRGGWSRSLGHISSHSQKTSRAQSNDVPKHNAVFSGHIANRSGPCAPRSVRSKSVSVRK